MNTSPFSENLPVNPSKVTARDRRIARLLTWSPWLAQLIVTVPLPLFFLMLFIGSEGTDSAAVLLLLLFVSLGAGIVVGVVLLILLLIYRRRWYSHLRDRLASDGITASEVSWFKRELSTEERKTWREMEEKNPLLADAYSETLAARLNATRIKSRAAVETLRIERQISRVRNLQNTDTSQLLTELHADL
ncbi:MAG TPA: hypothetical protein VJS64_13925, partial [Pyrinomonadaceae bacterium]|nr:hypothetical protein [Pyrinomonadaceae bacterium]